MTIARRPVVLGSLTLLLFLTGCRKPAGHPQAQPAPPAPAPSQPVIAPVSGPGGGVFATLPAANRDVLAKDLKQIYLAYQTAASTGQPPRTPEELGPDMRKQIQSIKEGIYVIFWGADPNRAPQGTSNTILGYVKDVPEKGGVVLMCDGSVRFDMTAQEFKSAPKAGQ